MWEWDTWLLTGATQVPAYGQEICSTRNDY